MPEILEDTFDIEVEGETYTFKAPGIKFRFEVGGRAADIRRRGSPEGFIAERSGNIDWSVDNFSRACAVLELYLVRSTTPWPYGVETVAEINQSAPPEVKFEKFPPGKEDTIDAVATAFTDGLARFRKGGNSNRQSTGA